jgi:hypothetical protein
MVRPIVGTGFKMATPTANPTTEAETPQQKAMQEVRLNSASLFLIWNSDSNDFYPCSPKNLTSGMDWEAQQQLECLMFHELRRPFVLLSPDFLANHHGGHQRDEQPTKKSTFSQRDHRLCRA